MDVERGLCKVEDVLPCARVLDGLGADRAGDEGAYISESGINSAGAVRGEKSCRMLSHCVAVVCRHECRERCRGDEGEIGLCKGLVEGCQERYLHESHPSLSIIDIASLTAVFQAASASTRVFKVSKVWMVRADLSG
jgi:hypothetical protein